MTRANCLFLALASAALLAATDGDVVFRSDVSLVRIDAQVVDRDNRAITGLGAGDFVVREEGRPQPIRNFASEDMPVDVLLLFDVSRSMRPHVERIASAAHQALQELRDQDRVGIMVFDRATRLRLPFRGNRSEVESEIKSMLRHEDFSGGTDITLGLLGAARYVGREGRPDARRAIVIVTDDQTQRDRDEAAVSRALAKANAVLCSLIAPNAMENRSGRPGGGGGGGGRRGGGGGLGGGLGGPLGGIILGRRGPYGGGGGGGGGRGSGSGPGSTGAGTHSAGTAEIARESGGDSLPVDDASALETTLARIRQRYALHFHLPEGVKAGEERNIEVGLAATATQRYPGAEVRYRRVYLVPEGGAGPTEVTRSSGPANANQAPAPVSRRRAVSEPDGSRAASPSLDTPPPAANSPSQPAPASGGGWRRVDEPSSAPGASPKAQPGQQP